MNTGNILDEIVHARKERIRRQGHALGRSLPSAREFPLQPFLQGPGIICEVKRRSPSRGDINAGVDVLQQAGHYQEQGVRSVSVLTEEDYFSGSLEDLQKIKKRFPALSLLRKDFLLDVQDVQVSYQAGADAVLLIAALHSPQTLEELYRCARGLGMDVLVEVHNLEEVAKIKGFQPEIVGINARNLRSFQTDRLHPLVIRPGIDWKAKVVYESGINQVHHADFAFDGGFDALLCGEGVMRRRELAALLIESAQGKRPRRIQSPGQGFWPSVAGLLRKRGNSPRPLVKICGITSREDALAAQRAGADLLGFVFAESPRRVKASLLSSLEDISLPKVGVLSGSPPDYVDPEAADLLERGLLDAVQWHGSEGPGDCGALVPSYKALRPQAPGEDFSAYPSPRLLLDAWHEKLAGGTGRSVKKEILENWKQPLWLAGGIGLDNLESCLDRWNPELIDVSSRLEEKPGKKDHALMESFFQVLDRRDSQ